MILFFYPVTKPSSSGKTEFSTFEHIKYPINHVYVRNLFQIYITCLIQISWFYSLDLFHSFGFKRLFFHHHRNFFCLSFLVPGSFNLPVSFFSPPFWWSIFSKIFLKFWRYCSIMFQLLVLLFRILVLFSFLIFFFLIGSPYFHWNFVEPTCS